MKFSLLALAIAVGSFANAAEVSSCKAQVQNKCIYAANILSYDVTANASECKIVQVNGEQHIAFISGSGGELLSVNDRDCSYSYKAFQSGLIIAGNNSNKQIGGRLFMVLSSKRVVVLTKDNAIYELNNSKNKPYSTVNGLSVDGDTLIMTQDGGGPINLTMEQLDKRIADGKMTLLSSSVNFY